MPTEAKKETVAELRQALAGSRTLITSEYRGLTVTEIAEIRRALRKQDVSYRVVKNRLMRIAAQDTIGEALGHLHAVDPALAPADLAPGDEGGNPAATADFSRQGLTSDDRGPGGVAKVDNERGPRRVHAR